MEKSINVNRYNLSDITFLIPIRLDSISRLENLILSINSLQKYFITNVKVLEADKHNNHILERQLNGVEYDFIQDQDWVYHRTKYQNILTNNIHTPYIAIWEADIIAQPNLIIQAMEALRHGYADVAFPYNGKVLNVSEIIRSFYIIEPNIDYLIKNSSRMNLLYEFDLVGGAIFINKEKYILAGKDNEKYYGWGNEDFERMIRWKALNYKIYRADGYLFHLWHTRGSNSCYLSDFHGKIRCGMNYLDNLCSQDEILKEIIQLNGGTALPQINPL